MQSAYTYLIRFFLTAVALMFAPSVYSTSLDDLVSANPKLSDSSISKAISEFRNRQDFSIKENNPYEVAFLEQKKILEGTVQSLEIKYQGSKWKQRSFNKFKRDINLVKLWGDDEGLSEPSRNMRRLYLALVFQEAKKNILEGNYQLQGQGILSTKNINYPCLLLKRFPNVGIDAFASLKKGVNTVDKSALAALGLNQKLAFSCPVVDKREISSQLQGYINAIEFINANDEESWKNIIFKVESEKLISNEVKEFPVFDYQKAIDLAGIGSKPYDRLSLALLKHVFEENSFEEVRSILEELKKELFDQHSLSQFAVDVLSGTGLLIQAPFDGTDAELKKYLVSLSMVLGGGAYTVPCGALIRRPELLSVTRPLFGSSYDNSLPRSDCNPENYPLPESVSKYMASANLPDGGWLNEHQGTMRFAHYKSRTIAYQKLQMFPTQINMGLAKNKHHLPYETWSYLNISNRIDFDRLKNLYQRALKDLSAHYIKYFSMQEEQAKDAAKAALWGIVKEGHWDAPHNTGLRYQILSGASDTEIKSTLDSVDDINELEHPGLSMKYYDGAWSHVGIPDSLLMISVHRPKVLAMLLEKKNTAWASAPTRLSQNNPVTDINYQSEIGKSALHTAVQVNNLESVKLLLDAGADINVKVTGSRRHSLIHADRSVAMYAASYSDLDTLKFLKSLEVPFDVQDSIGSNPVQYLIGNRYLDINPHLNFNNYKEYLSVIAPWMLVDSGKRILPRFNCEKAASFVEKRLCSNQKLAALDRMLMISYKRSRKTGDADLIRNEQLLWLKKRNKCASDECISEQYEQRISQLVAL